MVKTVSPSWQQGSSPRHGKHTGRTVLDKLTHELKGIGRNLNQLLILAHEGRIQRVDLSGVTAALETIYSALTELMTLESR